MYEQELIKILKDYKDLRIDEQIDYNKFYLYSLITHSTAIEGSTVTEIENRLLFDEGISAKGRSMVELLMNLDLKAAYEECIRIAPKHPEIDIDFLKRLSSLVMHNTGSKYNTVLGDFDSSKGDLRLVNVTAGVGGQSYLAYQKVPGRLQDFCDWLNEERKKVNKADVAALYRLSFCAHYYLVTIHPWVDGNGRMCRLLMNYLQMEFGLVPSKIMAENKAEYIQTLQNSRENGDLNMICDFLFKEHISNLQHEIDGFKRSLNEDVVIKPENVVINVVINDMEKAVLDLLRVDSTLSASSMAEKLEMSARQ
ncbi:Fic family protein, partial [Fibrobacter sp.]|uniref:Fic family protein n=1 Tax=Fibrobacter sp. TaxID=35828 RepID=UPI00388FDA78